MKRHPKLRFTLLACLVGAISVFGQGSYKIGPIDAPNSSDLPKPLQELLEPQGTRLLDGQGATVCEVWLGKAVPIVQNAGGSSDALYPDLRVGTLVGVLHFPKAGSDFRGQTIKAGFYTMRYAHIPQDGNHMGVNPYPDFVLLSPVAADTQLSEILKFDDLLKLSRQASGTPHPAVVSLAPVSKDASPPSLVQDDQGHWVLQAKFTGQLAGGGQARDVSIALVLVGQAAAA